MKTIETLNTSDIFDWLEGNLEIPGFPDRVDTYRPGRTGWRKNGTPGDNTKSAASRKANRIHVRDSANLAVLTSALSTAHLDDDAWLYLARAYATHGMEDSALACMSQGNLGVWSNGDKFAVLRDKDYEKHLRAKALGASRLFDRAKILNYLLTH